MNQNPIKSDEHLTECLLSLLTQNNESRKKYESILKQFCQNPICVMALLRQVQKSPKVEARHVAGVLLRSRLKKLWKRVPVKQQQIVKKAFLDILFTEKLPPIRSAIVFCVGEIAVFELPRGSWNDLGEFLKKSVSSSNDAHRETGMMLFGVLLELVPEQMMRNLHIVVTVFLGGLRDKNENVRDQTLRAMEFLIDSLQNDNQIRLIVQLMPDLFRVIKNTIINENYEMMKISFTLFDDIAELRSPVLSKTLPKMVQFMLDLANTPTIASDSKIKASQFIGWMFHFNSQVILQSNLLGPCVKLGVNMLHSPDIEDYTVDETTVFESGKQLIHQICVRVPSHLIFNKLAEVSFKFLKTGSLTKQRAGITILAVLSEGCYDRVTQNLSKLVPVMTNAAKSSDPQIRIAGIDGIYYYTENCKPEIRHYHSQIMPILVKSLDDQNANLLDRVISAIDSFAQCLDDEIGVYSKTLLKKLFGFMKHRNLSLRTSALTALDSVARGMGPAFRAFLPMTTQALTVFLNDDTLDPTNLLKIRAAEAVGNIAKAVGPKLFGPYLEQFMKFNISVLDGSDDNELREACFSCIGKFAEVFGSSFHDYIRGAVQVIHKTIETDYTQNLVIESSAAGGFLDDGDDMDTADFHDTAPDIHVLYEKAEAITALGKIASCSGRKFMGYFNSSINLLVRSLSYFHPIIKQRCIISLYLVVAAVYPNVVPPDEEKRWVEVVNNLLKVYNRLIRDDETKEVVEDVCYSISALSQTLKTRLFATEQILNVTCKSIRGIFQRRWACFEYDVKFPSVKEDLEKGDHDDLMDKAADTVTNLAQALGSKFSNAFTNILYQPILYYVKRKNPFDKIMVISTLAEVVKSVGTPGCLPYCKQLFRMCLEIRTEEIHSNMTLKRNIFYCLGILVEIAPQVVHKDILKKVINICVQSLTKERGNSSAVVIDNICGAVARILKTFRKTNDFPVAKILPLLLINLPLKEDMEEAENVYGCLLIFVKERNIAIKEYLPRLKEIFGRVLEDKRVEKDLKGRIVATMKGLENKSPSSN